MGIWTYSDVASTEMVKPYGVEGPRSCAYCGVPLKPVLGGIPGGGAAGLGGNVGEYGKGILSCDACGWWVIAARFGYAHGSSEGAFSIRRACGTLRSLDLTSVDLPMEELRQRLLARYGDRLRVPPKKYEDLVGGVFREFGYEVRVTSFSGDDGIDVFVLDGNGGDTIGVQVKRYAGKIEAEQIRAFAGALVLHGLTKGIFVTSSTFRPGAVETTKRLGDMGALAISLWDAQRFYEALRLVQRPAYIDPTDPSAPFAAMWEDPKTIPTVASASW